jgi:hypothetical protein
MVDTMMFRNSKNFMGDNPVEGLDELARVTVLNDNESQDEVDCIFIYKNISLFLLDYNRGLV